MPESSRLNIANLSTAVTRVLDAAQDRLGHEFELLDDFYWHLPIPAAFDMSKEPGELTVGQLSDDLELLAEEPGEEPAQAWHDLAHLIGLLRAVETELLR